MVQQPSAEQRTALLERHIGELIRRGYRVTSRTETTAQLVKPKEFSLLWALVWLGLTLCLLGVGILIYLLYYLAQKDKTVYLDVDPYGHVNVTPEWARRLIGAAANSALDESHAQSGGAPVQGRQRETERRKHTIALLVGAALSAAVGGAWVVCCVIAVLTSGSTAYQPTSTASLQTANTPGPKGTAPPMATGAPTTVPTPSYFTYVVQSGDTLSSIAADFGTTVDTIMDLNGLTSTTIYSGTGLILPGVSGPPLVPPVAATQASSPTRQPSPEPVEQYRGVRLGMPADDVLQVWGKGLRTEVIGQDSDGLVVAWVYDDARLIFRRSWLGGTYQYRVSEILPH